MQLEFRIGRYQENRPTSEGQELSGCFVAWEKVRMDLAVHSTRAGKFCQMIELGPDSWVGSLRRVPGEHHPELQASAMRPRPFDHKIQPPPGRPLYDVPKMVALEPGEPATWPSRTQNLRIHVDLGPHQQEAARGNDRPSPSASTTAGGTGSNRGSPCSAEDGR